MGFWGIGLFSNDTACDIRDDYRQLIEEGVDDAEATRQIMAQYGPMFDDPDDGTSALLAFAVTQSKIGRLDPAVRDRALAVIENGGDLALWTAENPKLVAKRKQVLAKARDQLTGPQPARKRLRRPSQPHCGLASGDVLALDLPAGPVLLRVVRVRVHRKGETPVIEELDYSGREMPPPQAIEKLGPKSKDWIGLMATDARFAALMDAKNVGWEQAGFRKVATIPEKAGDAEAPFPSSGITWYYLASRYRQR